MSQGKQYLLVVEDDLGLQKQLRWSFDNYDVVTASDRESAISQIRRYEPAVITLDLGLPPDPDGASEGLSCLQDILTLKPDSKVIILSGNQERENAVKAIGMGAYDFHQKPADPEILGLVIQRAFLLHDLQQENRKLLQQTQAATPLSGIISRDPGMLKVCRSIEKVAPSDATVMLLGESGTGKEILARGIHQLSPRYDNHFVAINCAAIPDNLLESELFGYEKGAYTGATKQTVGKIELANGGSFFLDEVGDLSMSLQAKLLRFLQERLIERVGGREAIPVDVRIICATHRNLKEMIQAGTFREDLYYRLSEIDINIPPLRQRQGDPALLAHHFKNRFCQHEGRNNLSFGPDALTAIENHSWPGNVREMENCIRRAVIMTDGNQINSEELRLDENNGNNIPLNLRQIREQAEYQAIVQALARSDGNMAKAAEILGITRPTLYDLKNKLAIQ